MTLLEYINQEEKGYYLPFTGALGAIYNSVTMEDIYNSPKKQLEIARYMEENFPSDFSFALDEGNIFCDALGISLKRPDFDFSMVTEHPIKSIEKLKELKIPDPYTDERMKRNIESLKLISSEIKKPLYISLQGPFTMATQLMGATDFLKATIKNPEFIKELLYFTGETLTRYSKAIVDAGVKMISIAEPSSVMIPPKDFPTMVVENIEKIFKNLDCWKCVHICGDTTKIYPYVLKASIDAFSFDQVMNLENVITSFPKDKVVIGNLDPIYLMGNGTPKDIALTCANIHNTMKNKKNFILSFGCTCSNNAPMENLKAASKWGTATYKDIENLLKSTGDKHE